MTFDNEETWQPSVRLRWIKRWAGREYEKVLQQYHVSNKGNGKWIDIPTEKEE